MIYEKEDKLINQLENQKYKGIKPLVTELETRMKDMDICEQQKFINNLYRNLSEYGSEKLDKVLNIYNKEHFPLKTNSERQEEYQQVASKITTLFTQYGNRYGKENADVDSFVKEQFRETLSELNSDSIQEIIDIVSKTLKKEDKDAFQMVSKEYGEKNHIRIRLSDFMLAQEQAKELSDKLNFDKSGLTEEEIEIKKSQAENDFKFAVLESAKVMKPDDFQAAIYILDKQLDYNGRRLLDSAIKLNNKKNQDKFETRRIKLSEKEKDASWQKIESESVFDRKLREFYERLEFFKNGRDFPEFRDKYDSGVVNKMLRGYAHLQDFIGEVGKFIKDNIDYYTKNYADKANDKESDKNGEKASENINNHNPASPFYTVIHDAYKEKGKELVNMLNSGAIDKETAEKLFVMDISYICSQDAIKQNELFSLYANSLSDAIKQQGTSMECKNTIMSFISGYERGIYAEQIKENIEKGYDWSDIHAKYSEKQENKTSNKKENQQTEKKDQRSEYEERVMKAAKAAAEAREIGKDIAEGEYKNADAKMTEFVKAIGQFSYSHQDMDKDQINQYAKIAIASMLTNGEASQDLINNLSQFNDKYFHVGNEKDMAYSLIVGASKIEAANRIHLQHHEPEQPNVFKEDISKAIEQKMQSTTKEKLKQEFISDIANRTKPDIQQCILAEEARKYSLNARSSRGLETEAKIKSAAEVVAEKYLKNAKTKSNRYDAKHGLIALCERVPESFGEQRVYDIIRDAVKDNPTALHALETDTEKYNELRDKWSDKKINITQDEKKADIIQESKTHESELGKEKENAEQSSSLGGMKKIEKFTNPNIEYVDIDLDAALDEINEEDKRHEASLDTVKDLIAAFNKDDNPVDRFSKWLYGKDDKEIRAAVTEIDKSIDNQTGSMRLIEALESNGVCVSAPYSEREVYGYNGEYEER